MEVDDFLEHYGTRGMKWGVRKQLQIRRPNERVPYIYNRDEKWASKIEAKPKVLKVTRIASRDIKKQSKELKAQYKAEGVKVKKGLGKTRYENELKDITFKAYERATYKVHGTSPTGLRKALVLHNVDESTLTIAFGARRNAKLDKQFRKITKSDEKRAKRSRLNNGLRNAGDQAFNPIRYNSTKTRAGLNAVGATASLAQRFLLQSDDSDSLVHEDPPVLEDFDGLELYFTLDEEGFVDDVLTPFDDDDLEQSSFEEDFLQHYGTVGMKWGVRKRSRPRPDFMPLVKSSSGKPKWQSAPAKKSGSAPDARGKIVKAKSRQKLSEDAAQFRDLRIKVKKEGLQSLNNKDIELINRRAEVMSKYNKAFPKKKSPLATVGEVALDAALSEFGSKKLVDFVGGPSPRTEKKDKQAETLSQVLAGARQIRKATKKSDKK